MHKEERKVTNTVTWCKPQTLRPANRNARTHSEQQIIKLARALDRLGVMEPLLVEEDGTLIAGHARLAAAKRLGWPRVPTIVVTSQMTRSEINALALALNRTAEDAGWDRNLLRLEFEGILQLDADFQLDDTGFEVAEIDQILLEPAADDDAAVAIESGAPAVSRRGDLWLLGPHRVLCGDATRRTSYRRLMGDSMVVMMITDPPYNVRVDSISGLGRNKHREFAMASGEMSESEFIEFLRLFFRLAAHYSRPGALHYVFIDWRHVGEMLAAGNAAYHELLNMVVWTKTNAGMGSLYRSQHELVLVYKAVKGPHRNNVQLGQHGRYRTNVWTYPGANTFGGGRDDDLARHPTPKPVALVQDAILDVTRRGDVVLDPLLGGGTTLIAAAKQSK